MIEPTEIITTKDSEEDIEYPSLKEPGWLYIKVKDGKIIEYDYEGGCVFWLMEWGCLEYVIEYETDLLQKNGDWFIEKVTAYYHRGDGYSTDDDCDWYFEGIREATDEEKIC